MAARRHPEHPHLGAAALTRGTLIVEGDLAITGPGVTARLRAGGDGRPALVVVEGVLPPGRRGTGMIAGRVAAAGLEMTVRDGRGRELGRVGPGLRSPLGRVLLGTSRARPTVRGLLAARRGASRAPVLPPVEHGGNAS